MNSDVSADNYLAIYMGNYLECPWIYDSYIPEYIIDLKSTSSSTATDTTTDTTTDTATVVSSSLDSPSSNTPCVLSTIHDSDQSNSTSVPILISTINTVKCIYLHEGCLIRIYYSRTRNIWTMSSDTCWNARCQDEGPYTNLVAEFESRIKISFDSYTSDLDKHTVYFWHIPYMNDDGTCTINQDLNVYQSLCLFIGVRVFDPQLKRFNPIEYRCSVVDLKWKDIYTYLAHDTTKLPPTYGVLTIDPMRFITTQHFIYIRKLRGGYNILYRYLQLRSDEQMLKQFIYYYTSWIKEFDEVEDVITDIIMNMILINKCSNKSMCSQDIVALLSVIKSPLLDNIVLNNQRVVQLPECTLKYKLSIKLLHPTSLYNMVVQRLPIYLREKYRFKSHYNFPDSSSEYYINDSNNPSDASIIDENIGLSVVSVEPSI
jgi:hypothetical protein